MENQDPANEPRTQCCGVDLDELRQRADDFARKEPLKAAGLACGAGLVLAALPLGRIAGAVVRAGFALAKPLLLVLGAVKLYEEWERKNTAANPAAQEVE